MLEQGGCDRDLRHVRQEYTRNLALTVKAVSLLFPEGTRVIHSEGGFRCVYGHEMKALMHFGSGDDARKLI